MDLNVVMNVVVSFVGRRSFEHSSGRFRIDLAFKRRVPHTGSPIPTDMPCAIPEKRNQNGNEPK